MPQPRSAVKFDLFAGDARKRKIESLGDPLQIIARHIDFAALAGLVDAFAAGVRTEFQNNVSFGGQK